MAEKRRVNGRYVPTISDKRIIKIWKRYFRKGKTVANTAAKYDVSKTTVSRIINRYGRYGDIISKYLSSKNKKNKKSIRCSF